MDKSIIKTAIPGPKSKAALQKQIQWESDAISYPKRLPIALDKAYGSYVQDIDGNIFIDFLLGAGSLPLGHSHPELVDEVYKQAKKLTLGLDFPTPIKEAFTEAHINMLPENLRNSYKLHFCGPTGADAVEAAIKLAKISTGHQEIISFRGGYHGCTNGALSVTGNRQMKKNFLGLMPGVHFFPFGSESHSQTSWVMNSQQLDAGMFLESALRDANSGLGNIAAIILELVQGEGGLYVAEKSFVSKVYRLSREFNIPLIIDEIQTGCGRTGTWYAFEQYDIEPDIFITSKGTSGIGLPSSLMFYKKELKNWMAGNHIGTFRGNQLAFSAGVNAIKIIKEERILDNVVKMSQIIVDKLNTLKIKFPFLGEIRGKGLMLGVEILDPECKDADEKGAKKIQELTLQNGLIIEVGGRNDTVIRLLPPLNVGIETVNESLLILEKVFTCYENLINEKSC
ncbi:aspartate aminotransferase family protein [Xenorhabdus sp. Sc-CR9]|uniref:aspartate aminotransferase family protein n=1 Tax=Xenorhabdus sp. Sc-CR9 TaxID=2584468 RepID=UPI001EFF8DE7|nr:diaminobutyrate--2-oxoglutarate transaminase family protein [Xenorhabdus sp. Sc-CR9]